MKTFFVDIYQPDLYVQVTDIKDMLDLYVVFDVSLTMYGLICLPSVGVTK